MLTFSGTISETPKFHEEPRTFLHIIAWHSACWFHLLFFNEKFEKENKKIIVITYVEKEAMFD